MPKTRKAFIADLLTFAAAGGLGGYKALGAPAGATEADLDAWQRDTSAVTSEIYSAYMRGKVAPKDYVSLTRLETAFDRVLADVRTADVSAHPAVWMVYNMGVIVKTKEACFSIDLKHRRAPEFAPLLDFALITHNHGDHFSEPFYAAMNGAGKIVISNFKDNYGVKNMKDCGFTRAEKIFRIRDVEIGTSLVDHNSSLIDFTTAFEIRVGNWRLYHTGDCGNAAKLRTIWGPPDLWVAFPGCGIDIAEGERRIHPKLMAFGHLWEMGHRVGRLTTPMVRAARKKVLAAGGTVTIPLWGERIV